MDPTSDDDDARHIELETLEAIFPELRRLGATGSDGLAFELEIPIETATSVTVTFPLAGNIAQEIVADDAAPENGAAGPEVRDSLDISHFPPLTLLIRLPDGYPETNPPSVTISVTPQWLGDKTLRRLEDDGPRLWEEMGQDLVAYTYIDHIQRGAEDVFGTIGEDGTLAVDAEHKLAVLDFDIKAKKAAFEKETFECGICLGNKTITIFGLESLSDCIYRSKKRFILPQNDGLRAHLLRSVPHWLL
jgi:E3 ubiquitin-protein ligase RNF14